jgi:hypothetical protein
MLKVLMSRSANELGGQSTYSHKSKMSRSGALAVLTDGLDWGINEDRPVTEDKPVKADRLGEDTPVVGRTTSVSKAS